MQLPVSLVTLDVIVNKTPSRNMDRPKASKYYTRYKIFYFPIMEPSTVQNNHLQIKEHKLYFMGKCLITVNWIIKFSKTIRWNKEKHNQTYKKSREKKHEALKMRNCYSMVINSRPFCVIIGKFIWLMSNENQNVLKELVKTRTLIGMFANLISDVIFSNLHVIKQLIGWQ